MTTISSSDSNAALHAAESATECAGLLLSTIIARKRSGWSVKISCGTTFDGTRPEMTGAPVTGDRPTPPNVNSGANDECRCCPPRLAKLPVRIHSSLLREEQRVLLGLLDAEVLEDRRAAGGGDASRRSADQ